MNKTIHKSNIIYKKKVNNTAYQLYEQRCTRLTVFAYHSNVPLNMS